MKSPVFRGPLLAAACAALVCASAANAQPFPATWARVPALPTACYSKDDPTVARLEATLEAIQTDHYAQNEINEQVRQEQNAIDPMELVGRMQEKMMADPQNAAKYIEETQNLGSEINAETVPALEKEDQMKSEAEAVGKRYNAALDQAYAPGNARWTALKKKMGIAPDSRGPGELGVPDWAWAEWGAILREWDRAYAATCPQWWGTGGQFHAYMKRYKDYLDKERLPYYAKHEAAKQANEEMLGTANPAYKSTAMYDATEDYIKRAYEVFGQREYRPHCTADRCE